jgi:two-component system, NarL family, nitrate/nitrite response regulator NarL
MSKKIRVMLVDDHSVLRMGLRMLIESQESLEVVGEAGDRPDALAIAECERPDVVLLDLDLGGVSGHELIPQLLSISPDSRIIILTGVRETDAHQRAIRLGASGIVLKDKADEVLFKAIEKVYAGEVWLSRSMIGSIFNEMLKPNRGTGQDPDAEKISTLTQREHEVIGLVAEGLKNKQIADRLFISEATVRNHLTSVFDKLGVDGRFALVIYSYRHGLVKTPI